MQGHADSVTDILNEDTRKDVGYRDASASKIVEYCSINITYLMDVILVWRLYKESSRSFIKRSRTENTTVINRSSEEIIDTWTRLITITDRILLQLLTKFRHFYRPNSVTITDQIPLPSQTKFHHYYRPNSVTTSFHHNLIVCIMPTH